MDSDTYYTLQILGVPASLEDIVTNDLFEGGASGVQENLTFTQLDRTYKPEIIESEIKDLIVYFEVIPPASWLEGFQFRYPNLKLVTSEHQIVDWLAQWKEQWKPFELVNGTWIVPEWHRGQFDEKGKQVIFIEPGMAFGTGTHATTQLAAQLMQSLFKKADVGSMVDVGTGSGILCFLAALEGVDSVFGYDNDEESKRVFHENLEKNFSTSIQWDEDWSESLKGKVDLTVANIIDGVLLILKPQFQRLKSDYYIFTGILEERESQFLAEMLLDWNLELIQRSQKDEWVGLLFQRKS